MEFSSNRGGKALKNARAARGILKNRRARLKNRPTL